MDMLRSTLELIITGLTLVVFVDVILSFVLPPFHSLRRALDSVVEPMLAPIRRVLPPAGGLDFSPAVLLIVIQIIGRVLVSMLSRAG